MEYDGLAIFKSLIKEVLASNITVVACCDCKREIKLHRSWFTISSKQYDILIESGIPVSHGYCNVCGDRVKESIAEMKRQQEAQHEKPTDKYLKNDFE